MRENRKIENRKVEKEIMMQNTPMEVALQTAKALGLSKTTIKEIEELSTPEIVTLTPAQIKEMREQANVSQGVMALYLNVNPSTYQKWERGEVKPRGSSLKLLNIVYQNGFDILQETGSLNQMSK